MLFSLCTNSQKNSHEKKQEMFRSCNKENYLRSRKKKIKLEFPNWYLSAIFLANVAEYDKILP